METATPACRTAMSVPLTLSPRPTPAADLRFHLVTGNCLQFAVADAATARQITSKLHPERAFSQRQWTLAEGGRLTTILPPNVERVDIRTPTPPDWFLHRRTLDVEEVFESVARHHHPVPTNHDTPRQIELEAELQSGATIYLHVYRFPSPEEERGTHTPLDLGLFLSHFTSGPALFGNAAMGGLFLLNPACIVRFVNTAPVTVTPPGAWPAHFVNEWSSV